MSQSYVGWWPATATLLAFVVFGGCDTPTGDPSLNTETDINAPLVQEKSFVFLGGPESEVDPLIDTTSSEFDSLFAVDSDSDISIVQELDNFDIGALDGVLDDAAGDYQFSSQNFSQEFIDLSDFTPPSFSDERIGKLIDEGIVPSSELNVSTTGTIEVSGSGRTAFDQSGENEDYVELSNTQVIVDDVDVSPTANQNVFSKLTYSYPDVRLAPFNEPDSLVVEFVDAPCGPGPCGEDGEYERDIANLENGFTLTLEDVRVYPDKPTISASGETAFNISGNINNDLLVSDNDVLSLAISTTVENFDIQELDVAAATPFNTQVTSDADAQGEPGYGEIDIARDGEANVASFDGFESVTGRLDGLELADVDLVFSLSTRNLASTDAALFSAIQGQGGTSAPLFLKGEMGTEREVESSERDPFDKELVENGNRISSSSLIQLGADLEDASLGQTVNPSPDTINEGNSNADDLINALPTEIRLVSQAQVNMDGGDLKIREPVELDASFTLDVPLRIKERFMLRDTIDADFSDLEDLTDPDENLNISTAELQFSYTNGLPLGADVKMVIVDEQGSVVETFNDNFDDGDFRLEPAQKGDDGAAERPVPGDFVFNLGDTQEELRDLADGEEIQLVLNMDQEGSGGTSEAVASLRADDQLTINQIRLNVTASVQTGD